MVHLAAARVRDRYAGHRQPALFGRRVSLRWGAGIHRAQRWSARHRRSGRSATGRRSPISVSLAGSRLRWPLRHPWELQPRRPRRLPPARFLPTEAKACTRFRWGRVHAGIIQTGPFPLHRQLARAVVRLEETRLGYVHKGIESLLQTVRRWSGRRGWSGGYPATARWLMPGLRSGGRGAATTEIAARAHWFAGADGRVGAWPICGDIGAVCNDAAFALMLAIARCCARRVLRASAAYFRASSADGCVIPGAGRRLPADGVPICDPAVEMHRAFPPLVELARQHRLAAKTAPPIPGRSIRPGPTVRLRQRDRPRHRLRHFRRRRRRVIRPTINLSSRVPVRRESDNPGVDSHPRKWNKSLALSKGFWSGAIGSGAWGHWARQPAGRGHGAGRGLSRRHPGLVRLAADGTVAPLSSARSSWFQWPLPLESRHPEGNIVADFPCATNPSTARIRPRSLGAPSCASCCCKMGGGRR